MCFGGLSGTGLKQAQAAAGAFAAIIQQEAAQGWRFLCFDTTVVHGACFGCLSQKAMDLKLLVFYQD
jgi:hypothetical protein